MKILLVEDSASMRSYLANIIESGTEDDDVEIVEAANGFEALKTLPHHKFDAILTDINMPDINGLELVSFLEQKYGITIQDEELVPDNLDSIDRLVRFVSRKAAIAV